METSRGFFMPKFIENGDPDWIRTSNLPLRRGLLYPVEPRGHCQKLRMWRKDRRAPPRPRPLMRHGRAFRNRLRRWDGIRKRKFFAIHFVFEGIWKRVGRRFWPTAPPNPLRLLERELAGRPDISSCERKTCSASTVSDNISAHTRLHKRNIYRYQGGRNPFERPALDPSPS